MNSTKQKKQSSYQNSRYAIIVLISIIALAFVFPIFIINGLWASFDTPFHVTMIAQFHDALKNVYFPVVWTQGVANYGLPFGLIAHPMTSYLGGFLTLFSNNPILSYKILWALFSLISVFGFYRLLRRFVGVAPAIAGSVLYAFSAYRILNVYIRGALPEFAAAAFLPFLLYALFDSIQNKNKLSIFVNITLWFFLILFTHPMYILFAGLMTFLFLLYFHRNIIIWLTIASAIALAIGMNAFYLIPLKLELKYFYIGQAGNMLVKGSGLTPSQLFIEKWEFTCADGDTEELRCNRIQTGFPEIAMFAFGFIFLLFGKKNKNKKTLGYFLALGSISTFLILQMAEFLYERISLLGSVQFPYRFLNVWLLGPPMILASFLDTIRKYQKVFIVLSIVIIVVLRLPQVYTKSEYNPTFDRFYHNIDNIHSVMMNTIWMDESKNYPVKNDKIEIIQGDGIIKDISISPTKHEARLAGKEDMIVANYTFFFPGWHAYLDEQEIPIQWQDPAHRGHITVNVPQGEHQLRFAFEDTGVRLASKLVSLMSILFFGFIIYIYRVKPKWFTKMTTLGGKKIFESKVTMKI